MENNLYQLIALILLVLCLISLVGIGIYIFKNIEEVKNDPCGVCENHSTKMCIETGMSPLGIDTGKSINLSLWGGADK